MPFVHCHAPNATPDASDPCLVIEADRLLAAPDVTERVVFPVFGGVECDPQPTGAPLHVGLIDGRPCWLVAVENAAMAAPADWQWHDTRSLLGVLTPSQAQAVSCARQLMWWDRRHRFCGACGTPTVTILAERARRCPKCQALFFPVASPAVIVAVTRGDELLLAHNRHFRAGMFSLLAGFVDPGETLEQAVTREVEEEVGIAIGDVRYVTSQPWSFPNSLMVGFEARHVRGELKADGAEIEQAGWFRRDALPDVPRIGTVARLLIDRWRNAGA